MTEEFLKTADDLAFPILLTEYDVPWIAFAKTVALANSNQEHTQMVQTMRIYDLLRKSIHSTPEKIIKQLSEIINCQLWILDVNNNKPLFHKNTTELSKQFDRLQSSELPFSINRIKQSDKMIVKLPIPTTRPTSLLAISNAKTPPNTIILRHVATVLGLVVEREISIFERNRRIGADIFINMIQGQFTDDVASILLKEHGLGTEPFRILALSTGKTC